MQKSAIFIAGLMGLAVNSEASVASSLLRSSHVADVPITNFDDEKQKPAEVWKLSYIKDSGRYAAPIDLSTEKDDKGKNMSIALYESTSLLVEGSCFNIEKFNCRTGQCEETAEKTINYPFYTATGKGVKTTLYPDTTGLKIEQDSPIVWANTCVKTAKDLPVVSDGFGLIALGVNENNDRNLKLNKKFTVSFEEEKINTVLVDFREQTFDDKPEEYQKRHTLKTDGNWHAELPNLKVEVGTKDNMKEIDVPAANYKVIYDINFPYIGIPANLFVNLEKELIKSFKCEGNFKTKEATSCKGVFPKLPSFTLRSGETNITFAPEDYLNNTNLAKGKSDDQDLQIMLVALDNQAEHAFKVTENYNDYIIIGNVPIVDDILVFNSEDKTITTFFVPPKPVLKRVIAIFAGLFAFAILVVLFDYCVLTKKLQRMKKEAALENGETAPLVKN